MFNCGRPTFLAVLIMGARGTTAHIRVAQISTDKVVKLEVFFSDLQIQVLVNTLVEILIDFVYMTAVFMTSTEPQGLSLYMDDGWLAWTIDFAAFERFHDALNSVFPGQMIFTYELEDDEHRLTFLDLTLIREDSSIEYEFYQKETHSCKYLDYI